MLYRYSSWPLMFTPLSVEELKLRRGLLQPAKLLGSGVKVISWGGYIVRWKRLTFRVKELDV